MPINPSIALSGKPMQLESPVNAMAQVMQLQGAQQANALNQMKMAEMQRGLEEQNALRAFLPTMGAGQERDLLRFGASGKGIYESIIKGDKEKREAAKAQEDIDAAKIKKFRDFLPSVNDPQTYAAWRAAAIKEMPSYASAIPEQFSPEIKEGLMMTADKALERHFVSRNLGGTTDVVGMPKYGSGPASVVPGSVGTVSLTPYETEKLPLERQRVGLEGQRVNLERQRVGLEDRRVKVQEAEAGLQDRLVANTTTDAAGNVTQYNRFGQVIQTQQGKGKPSATFEKTQEARKQLGKELDQAIFELSDVTKDGGLIDQSTGSGVGRGVDFAAGLVGVGTQGAIATARLKPIADIVLKMVPRFEGPQSDKDTQSYKEAAGQIADSSLPNNIRKAAGKELVRIMNKRKDQFVTSDMATQGINPSGGVDANNPLLK